MYRNISYWHANTCTCSGFWLSSMYGLAYMLRFHFCWIKSDSYRTFCKIKKDAATTQIELNKIKKSNASNFRILSIYIHTVSNQPDQLQAVLTLLTIVGIENLSWRKLLKLISWTILDQTSSVWAQTTSQRRNISVDILESCSLFKHFPGAFQGLLLIEQL